MSAMRSYDELETVVLTRAAIDDEADVEGHKLAANDNETVIDDEDADEAEVPA